jgi:hypothetical protein
MNTPNEEVVSIRILNELVACTSGLPAECQELLLAIAKGMAFTRDCINKRITHLSKGATC